MGVGRDWGESVGVGRHWRESVALGREWRESVGVRTLKWEWWKSVMVGHQVVFRDIYLADVEKVDEFCKTGCGCSMNCATNFSMKHFLLTRGNAQQMHRKEVGHGHYGTSDGLHLLQ